MMKEAIKNFARQFEYEPEVQNPDKLRKHHCFIVVGMGGSHLAADLVKLWNPYADILVHENYGLPPVGDDVLRQSLIIADSYSGNTEEVIDAFKEADKKGLSVAVISIGGKLIELAKDRGIPYIQLPDEHLEPRSALGLSVKALLKIMDEPKALERISELAETLRPKLYESRGKELAEKIKGHVPIIYSSARNAALAYNWKIKFNETGKIPAFYNTFPELNHNEMTGFDVKSSTRPLAEKFHFIFLKDADDYPKIQKRMKVLGELYKNRKLPVEIVELENEGQFQRVFNSLILADWTAYYTAELYGVESEKVPMVEEFKKLIR